MVYNLYDICFDDIISNLQEILFDVCLCNYAGWRDVFDNKLNYFLRESSLMLYLSQVLPLDMVKALFADCSGYTKTILMVLFTIVNAMACKVIGDLFLRIMVKLKKI